MSHLGWRGDEEEKKKPDIKRAKSGNGTSSKKEGVTGKKGGKDEASFGKNYEEEKGVGEGPVLRDEFG
jgi:hypothetical protein